MKGWQEERRADIKWSSHSLKAFTGVFEGGSREYAESLWAVHLDNLAWGLGLISLEEGRAESALKQRKLVLEQGSRRNLLVTIMER